MKDYVIFLDSSADIDPSFIKEHGIGIVSMSYTFGNQNRICDGTEDEAFLKRFYDGQRAGDLTQTSQVTPQQYMDAFTPALEKGKDVLCISLSGGLTNSHDSIRLAKIELAETFPDRTVYSVDSLGATAGIGLLAELAVKNREAGLSAEENARELDNMRHKVCHLFMVEDLMYLKRGGRIPAAAAVIGTALGVKPILVIDEKGTLTVTDKKRGEKNALEELERRFLASRDPQNHRVAIIHADAPQRAEKLASKVRDVDPEANITIVPLGPVIGAHTGPGLAAVIYFGSREAMMK